MLGRNVNAFEALQEQLACLEAYVGDEPQDADVTFFGRMTEIYTKPSVQRGILEGCNKVLEDQVATLITILEEFKGKIKSLKGEI